MERFDVVVVGGRCAGAPLAIALARRGVRVCVLERSRFPSDTPSTHVIQPRGVTILRELGVLDDLWAAGAIAVDRGTLMIEDIRIDVEFDAEELAAPGLCMRRVTLDPLLADAAAPAGADVRTGTAVTGLLRSDGGGRVIGVETDAGPVGAALVVGADGRRSTVARLAGAREYDIAPPGRAFLWAYFEGAADDEARLRLGRIGNLAFLACPTDGGLYMAGAMPPFADKQAFLADRERNFMHGLQAWPEVGDIVAGATRVGPIRVVADWHGYFRTPTGPGWVLVGDAGHFKDPTPAQGITDALRQGQRLAGAIESGLGGGAHLDDELAQWGRWRDADGIEMHRFAAIMGAANRRSPLVRELIRGLAEDPAGAHDLVHVLNRDLPPSRLFGPRQVLRAAARSVRAQPRQTPAVLTEVASGLRDQVRLAWRRRGGDRQTFRDTTSEVVTVSTVPAGESVRRSATS
jgi:menaquinone-9 beta-reductase